MRTCQCMFVGMCVVCVCILCLCIWLFVHLCVCSLAFFACVYECVFVHVSVCVCAHTHQTAYQEIKTHAKIGLVSVAMQNHS